jgi:hypothetical protein
LKETPFGPYHPERIWPLSRISNVSDSAGPTAVYYLCHSHAEPSGDAPSLLFFISVDSNRDEVVCFVSVSNLVILKRVNGLRMGSFEGLARGERSGPIGLVRVAGLLEVVGVGGVIEGLEELGIELSESIGDSGVQGLATEGASEFVFGHGKSLRHDLSKISEGVGSFEVDLTAGDGAEEATEAAVEGAGTDIVCADTRRDVVPGVFGGEALELSLGVEVTEVGIAGLAGRFAAAAIGKGESTQGRAVLGEFLGHRDLLTTD